MTSSRPRARQTSQTPGPDPADPAHTLCGFTYAGDCGDFAPAHACKQFAPHDFYRKCQDHPIGTSGFVLP